MTAQKHTPINRDEKCAFCGYPRHAHWGGPQALVYGRCAGFESSAKGRLEAFAPEIAEKGLALIDALERYGFPVSEAAAPALMVKGSREAKHLNSAVIAFRAAIAKAEGRSHG